MNNVYTVGNRHKSNIKNFFRHDTYSIGEMFELITNKNGEIICGDIFIGDIKVKANSVRYAVFKKYGISCVNCGIEGEYFALEKDKSEGGNTSNRFHFNLYGVDDNGNESLITKDHIIPKSKGGRDFIDNLQPMCKLCNVAKGSFLKEDFYNIFGLEHIAKFLKDYGVGLEKFIKYVDMYNNLNSEDKERLVLIAEENKRYKQAFLREESKKSKVGK